MSALNRFRVNTPNVTHETIDGETVIINLDTGSYYSMNGAGAAIWNLLDSGAALGEIGDAIAAGHAGKPDEIAAAVNKLVERLQQESLIAPDSERTARHTFAAAVPDLEKSPFEPPQLHKYTDMEDLLLLDPIHDVDETGWPNKQ